MEQKTNPQHNKNKILITVAGLSVIALLAIVGYFVLLKYSAKPVVNQTQQSLEKVDTSGWKTYVDKQYSFEFQYPSYFFRPVLTEDDEVVFQTNSSQDDGLIVKTFKRNDGFHLNEFFPNCVYDEQTKEWSVAKPDTVNYTLFICPTSVQEKDGMKQYIYTGSDEEVWEEDALIDSGGELLVNIAVRGSQVSKNTGSTFSSIISTFKFTAK